MKQGANPAVLQRKMGGARQDAPTADDMTIERAWRLAVVRGLSAAVAMRSSVAGYATASVAAADIAALVEEGDLAVLLEGPSGFGAAILDMQLMAAMIEAQTMGRVLPRAALPRPATRTDAAMVADPLDCILAEFERRAAGLPGAEAATELRFATMPSGAQAMALALPDAPHVLCDMTLRLTEGERTGRLRLILPVLVAEEKLPDADPHGDWADGLERSLLGSTLVLNAVLARLRLPADEVTRWAPGDLLPLSPQALSQVAMTGCTGQTLVRGRLGQSGGTKAVLLADPDPLGLSGPPARS